MSADAWVAKAERYSRLRWLGVVYFCVAAPTLMAGIAAWATDRAPGRLVLLCLFATGLSLGSFGTNDDAALHAFADLDRKNALPARFREEWDAERKRRPARAATLHDHPKASLVVPLAASAALGFAVYRVLVAWGVA